MKSQKTKVAVLADIHNNHVAFETCISYALQQGIHNFILLGDYVSDCPYPQKTMHRIYELMENYDCKIIRGNREEYVLDYHESETKNWKPGSASGSLLYNYQNLTERDIAFFQELPNHARVEYEGCPALTICHGSPENSRELLHEGAECTKRILRQLDTDYLVCGHTHIQSVWEYEGKQIINPGALGMPKGYGGRTQFAIMTGSANGWSTELIQLPYDVEREIAGYETSGLREMAPSWVRMAVETLRTGIDRSAEVVKHVGKLCEGESEWPDYPEEAWRQAIREILGDIPE